MGADSSRPGLSPTEMTDLKRQTVFTPKEIRDWHAKFHADCPKGEMSRAELTALYAQIFPDGDPAPFTEHIFKLYDKDGSGTIDFTEFLCTVSIASRGTIDEKLRWAFSMYDLDGNGYVTRKEVTEIVKAISRMRGRRAVLGSVEDPASVVGQLFKYLDKDGDDQLSEIEFVLGAKQTPSVLALVQSDQAVQ